MFIKNLKRVKNQITSFRPLGLIAGLVLVLFSSQLFAERYILISLNGEVDPVLHNLSDYVGFSGNDILGHEISPEDLETPGLAVTSGEGERLTFTYDRRSSTGPVIITLKKPKKAFWSRKIYYEEDDTIILLIRVQGAKELGAEPYRIQVVDNESFRSADDYSVFRSLIKQKARASGASAAGGADASPEMMVGRPFAPDKKWQRTRGTPGHEIAFQKDQGKNQLLDMLLQNWSSRPGFRAYMNPTLASDTSGWVLLPSAPDVDSEVQILFATSLAQSQRVLRELSQERRQGLSDAGYINTLQYITNLRAKIPPVLHEKDPRYELFTSLHNIMMHLIQRTLHYKYVELAMDSSDRGQTPIMALEGFMGCSSLSCSGLSEASSYGGADAMGLALVPFGVSDRRSYSPGGGGGDSTALVVRGGSLDATAGGEVDRGALIRDLQSRLSQRIDILSHELASLEGVIRSSESQSLLGEDKSYSRTQHDVMTPIQLLWKNFSHVTGDKLVQALQLIRDHRAYLTRGGHKQFSREVMVPDVLPTLSVTGFVGSSNPVIKMQDSSGNIWVFLAGFRDIGAASIFYSDSSFRGTQGQTHPTFALKGSSWAFGRATKVYEEINRSMGELFGSQEDLLNFIIGGGKLTFVGTDINATTAELLSYQFKRDLLAIATPRYASAYSDGDSASDVGMQRWKWEQVQQRISQGVFNISFGSPSYLAAAVGVNRIYKELTKDTSLHIKLKSDKLSETVLTSSSDGSLETLGTVLRLPAIARVGLEFGASSADPRFYQENLKNQFSDVWDHLVRTNALSAFLRFEILWLNYYKQAINSPFVSVRSPGLFDAMRQGLLSMLMRPPPTLSELQWLKGGLRALKSEILVFEAEQRKQSLMSAASLRESSASDSSRTSRVGLALIAFEDYINQSMSTSYAHTPGSSSFAELSRSFIEQEVESLTDFLGSRITGRMIRYIVSHETLFKQSISSAERDPILAKFTGAYFNHLRESKEEERLSDEFLRAVARAQVSSLLGAPVTGAGGATGARFTQDFLTGEKTGVFKAKGQNPWLKQKMGQASILATEQDPLAQPHAEVIAFQLDKRLGFNMSPESTMVQMTIDGRRENGAILNFLAGYKPGESSQIRGLRADRMTPAALINFQKMAIFDFLIGNLDRHEDNFFFQEARDPFEDLKLIDNANAFPYRGPSAAMGNTSGRNMYKWKAYPISQAAFSPEVKAFIVDNLSMTSVMAAVDWIRAQDFGELFIKEPRTVQFLQLRVQALGLVLKGVLRTPAELANLKTRSEIEKALSQVGGGSVEGPPASGVEGEDSSLRIDEVD